jgi:WD40 repeat protein
VRVWNAAPSTAWRLYPPQAARGGEWTVQGVDWSSDSRYLIAAGGDVFGFTEPGSLAIWDVQENKLVMEEMQAALNLMAVWAYFSPDDRAFIYMGNKGFPDFSDDKTAYVFDAKSGQIIRSFTPGGDIYVRSADWSPDGSMVATGLWNGTIVIWDYESGAKITTIQASDTPDEWIDTVAWSPDGSKIAADYGDLSAAIRVWDAHTWQPLFTVQHDPPTCALVAGWSPDSKRLLTTAGNFEQGAKDNTARVWDGETGKELLVFRGHTRDAMPGGWSPDGKRIVTAGFDGTVRVWDSSTGDELLTLSAPGAQWGTSWSPNGKYIAIGGWETLVSVWRVWQSTEELVAYARECCVIRPLSEAERKQFALP